MTLILSVMIRVICVIRGLSIKYMNDRVTYTNEKTNFILEVTEEAKKYYMNK
ncbi:MAG: hypothetical protein AB1521_16420 [Bacteroidota bacterium]